MIEFQVQILRGGGFWNFLRPETDSRGFRPFSRAKCCPICLEVWAVIWRTNVEEACAIEGQLCDWHTSLDPNVIPGSLLDDRTSQTVDLDLIDHLPLELKQREFDLHVKALETDSHEHAAADFARTYTIAYDDLTEDLTPYDSTGVLPPSGS